MPHVAIGRIARAIKTLKRYHPFFGVTFLSMKKSGIQPLDVKEWGSEEENNLLRLYYEPEGAPGDKKFYVPFAGPAQDHGDWKNAKYSGGSLQRARVTDQFKDALLHPSRKEWAFAADYVSRLKLLLPGSSPSDRIPVNDLAAWLYRDVELDNDLAAVQQRFFNEFNITDVEKAELFRLDSEENGGFFFDEPVSADDLTALIGGVPRGASFGQNTEIDLLGQLVTTVKEDFNIILPDGFVESIYHSLKAQPFLVLAGKPGTAKSSFAKALATALAKFFGSVVNEVSIAIGKDFTEADVIGYEKISGDLAATDLTRQLLLTDRKKDIFIVILDEMNLSEVDSYLARLLPALESGHSVQLPGVKEAVPVPTDTFVIGTINSYLDEVTRLPLSGPVKRRANIVEMPNHLTTIVMTEDRAAFDSAALTLVRQSLATVRARRGTAKEGVFDASKILAFEAACAPGGRARAPEILDLLWEICRATRDVLTMGVLQDVLDYVSLSTESLIVAIDRQVARKIVPQLSGPSDRSAALLALINRHVSSDDFVETRRILTTMIEAGEAGAGTVLYPY